MADSIQDVLWRLDSAATEGRKFQVLLMGCKEDIHEAIHALHALGYADTGAWSPVVPMPNSTKMMSILTRYRSSDGVRSV
jgi:alkanesulfonate monooxygenase SsuD/methylene tetrahydromethanopterin reductase-like flavin-dependent oxidoreductase (luciferase family)